MAELTTWLRCPACLERWLGSVGGGFCPSCRAWANGPGLHLGADLNWLGLALVVGGLALLVLAALLAGG